jgi:type I restriction enzyme S subunit
MQLTVDWKIKALGEIAEVQSGGTPLKAHNEYWSGDIPWYASGELNETFTHASKSFITQQGLEQSNAKLFPKGSLLIGMYDTAALKMSILDRDAAFNQAIAGVKPNENIDLTFILYAIDSRRFEILNQRRGVRQKNLSLAKIKNIKLPIPQISEQKRIVAILDEAFEGIDRAIANTEKNLANARELFESYLNAIFTQKGDGWEEKKFGDIALLSRGQNPPKSKFVNSPQEGYVRFYQIRDGKNDDYEVYVPDTPQLHKVEPDDILMVAYRHIGRVFRGASGAFNVALCKIKNKDRSVLHDDYLFHIIPTDFVRGELMKQAERSLIPSMSVKHLAEIKIPVPPIDEQEIIVSKINNLYSETQRLETIYRRKITALKELKQSILQKAFTGELTADTLKTAKEEIAA